MLQKNLSFRFPSFFILILSILCYTTAVFPYAPPEGLKEKIKKAKSFEDIFKLEKSTKLEPARDAFIARVNAMVISEQEDIIINDVSAGGSDILIFSKIGKFIRSIGKKGSGPGEYTRPQSMTRDTEGNIYVVDGTKRQINIYDKNYKFRTLIHYVSNNSDIHVNSKKDFYLYLGIPMPIPSAKLYNCVAKFGPDGKKKTEFAELPAEVNKMKFYAGYDCMVIDKYDYVYETNPLRPCIRKYDADGKLIKEFGDKRIKMITEKDEKGSSYEIPRFIESFKILDNILIIAYCDGKMDFYDTDGNLLNQDIKLDKGIACVHKNAIYLVEHQKNQDNPTLHKYIVK